VLLLLLAAHLRWSQAQQPLLADGGVRPEQVPLAVSAACRHHLPAQLRSNKPDCKLQQHTTAPQLIAGRCCKAQLSGQATAVMYGRIFVADVQHKHLHIFSAAAVQHSNSKQLRLKSCNWQSFLLKSVAGCCLLLTQLIFASAQVNAQWRNQLLPASPAAPHWAPAAAAAAAGLQHIHCTTKI
jgi:hypothetical protein